MRFAILLIAASFLASALSADDAGPSYTAAGIVNAADNETHSLAPNTLASLYGVRLSYVTASISPGDIQGGVLPTVLPGTGVHVTVGNLPATMYYVSPDQVNFLVPANLLPGASTVQVVLDGHSGPAIKITLAAASPALFQLDSKTAVAIHPDGTVITDKAPAKPGEIIILYATGLGQTLPPVPYGQLFNDAAPLVASAQFRLTLAGATASNGAVQYAGIAPGFAGLYQINLLIPKSTKANPEIRIGFGKQLSIAGIHLPIEP
ncbi:MAG TPA: hypothetical protein VKT81_04245 [Bryobacteraceae bacterium]|nr:hypothetical protein [Bryobacteraceae bacterium]